MHNDNRRGAAYKIQLISYACSATAFWALAIYTVAVGVMLVAAVSTMLAVVLSLRCRHIAKVGFTIGQDHFAMLFYAPIAAIVWLYRGNGVPAELVNYTTIAWIISSAPLWHGFISSLMKNRRVESDV